VNSHNTTSATETIIEAAEVDSADTKLAKSRSTHDAGLDGHVEVRVVQDVGVVAGHDLGESDELGVAGALGFAMLVIIAMIVYQDPTVSSRIANLSEPAGDVRTLRMLRLTAQRSSKESREKLS
jgi:hypothetical protein